MGRLNVKRGVGAGVAVSIVVSAAVAARFSDPPQTFVYVLAVAIATMLVVVWAIATIDRRLHRSRE